MTTPTQCPLCKRPMPEGSYNAHHLIPATFKGREVVNLHKVCHDMLHHIFSEREMEHHYNTIDRILEHDAVASFVKWVKKQPAAYYSKCKDTTERKRKRRR